MLRIDLALVGSVALLAAGCHTVEKGPLVAKEGAPSEPLQVAAAVTVKEDGAGGYAFSYDAPFADEKGNFDFAQGAAYGRVVTVTFAIAAGSVPGLKFKANGADAFWIADKSSVGSDGSPTGPYRGEVFHDLIVGVDQTTLAVTSENNDRTRYRYGLRFDLGGETVVDDPDWNNDGQG